MTTSRQLRPQPQAYGTAATSARNGTITNRYRAICSQSALGFSSNSGFGLVRVLVSVVGLSRTALSTGGGGVMWLPRGVTRHARANGTHAWLSRATPP